MANPDVQRGLIPVGSMVASPYSGRVATFLATGATGAIYIGSPVTVGGDSGVFNGFRYPTVGGGFTSGNVAAGVCVGVLPVTRESALHRADSEDRLIMVNVDPYAIYEAQDSQAADADALQAAEIGQVADLTSIGGSTVTGRSTVEVDGDTATTEYTDHDVEILDIVRSPDNELGAHARYRVRLLRHHALGTINALAGN